jgi:hypothetical protein
VAGFSRADRRLDECSGFAYRNFGIACAAMAVLTFALFVLMVVVVGLLVPD